MNPVYAADAELQRRVAEPHLHVRHLRLRADAQGGAAAAFGGDAAVPRLLPERQLVRRRHLGVRLDQAPHQQPGAGRHAELRLLLRRQRQRSRAASSTRTGNTVDIGVSNLFSTTCNTSTATYVSGTTVSDYTGADRAVRAVGAGGVDAGVDQRRGRAHRLRPGRQIERLGGSWKDAAPWTDPTYYFIRNSGAGSTVLSALMFNVPKTKFWGIDRLSTDNLRDSMLASTEAEASIGILSIVYADKNRGNLRSLYLQAPRPDLRLPARLEQELVRQDERARRPLSAVGLRALLHARRRRRRALGRGQGDRHALLDRAARSARCSTTSSPPRSSRSAR